MGGGYSSIRDLGAFLIWMLKGFRGKYSEWRENENAFILGLSFIIVVVLILGGRLW
ncbi:hypothetical protein P8625_01860 [Tenacibaculum tangerinum]|uniref:Uncharacterized protein n=1 Tax=Tenacibaculum tangerinum TaxID=3038772 RepID=A0ABY8L3D1_9FLAO|nr:hypothetical protein [Tenacibaculum tangerinum]WGH75937.1 hypothetical protein P8625_01860 [Tenacibaculum tangerinum]